MMTERRVHPEAMARLGEASWTEHAQTVDRLMAGPTKRPMQSRTIVGALVVLIGTVAGQLGHDFGPAEAQAWTQMLTAGATLLGSALVLHGRLRARSRIVNSRGDPILGGG